MQVFVNGSAREIADGSTVASLVASLELAPEKVAVERNGALVPRAALSSTTLREGDSVELVTLVGGG